MSTITGQRVVQGAELPASGTWRIDPGHAQVAFIGRHLVLTRVRGTVRVAEGRIVVGERPEDSSVEVVLDMAAVDSGDAARDEHLRSAELLDVAAHPTAAFRSTAVRVDGQQLAVDGDLTIRGTTAPVTLTGAYLGGAVDPWGGVRAVFTAGARIDREDWGLTWNMALEAGGLLVSKQIDIEIDVEAVLAQP